MICEHCGSERGAGVHYCLHALKARADENWKLYQETIFQLNAAKEQRDNALLQLSEAQEVIKLCIDQGGLSFHDEWRKCPEDDTCDCPDVKRVNAAMKGYTEKRVDEQQKSCPYCQGGEYHETVCRFKVS